MGLFSFVGDFFFGWLQPDVPEALPPGTELTSAQTDAFIGKVIGLVEKATGNIIFKETNDADNDDIKNDLLHIIVVWSEAVESIDEVYIDDIPASSNNPAFFHDDGGRIVHVRNFPNGMDGYTDPHLTNAGWRSTDKSSGKACSYIRLEYHGGEYAISSEPKLTADLTGTNHSNPSQALSDYLQASGYGKGLSSSLLNLSSFDAAEVLCDSRVEEVAGQTQTRPLFSCNIKLDTSEDVLENVNKLLKPMRGWLPIINGQLTLVIEKDDEPVSVPILERDILTLDRITEGNKSQRYNRVAVTYYDPDADGTAQEAVYPEAGSAIEAQLLAEDNGVLLDTSVELKTCRNWFEAFEFAKTWLEVSRQQTRTRITLPKWGLIYHVGDIVPVYHSFPGWEGKLFRIETVSSDRKIVTLGVREHQPYIYDFFGEGNKPELPDTSYSNAPPSIPSDLEVEHVYTTFTQVKVTWVSESLRFTYQVISSAGLVLESETIARRWVELSGYALGTYSFRVRALGGLAQRSGWAEIPIVMQKPGVPTDITVNAGAFELEVIPYLAGSDSSTAFLFAISHDVEDVEPPTPHRGPAHAYTFPALAPNREFKIWVCSTNALGDSDWTSVLASTTTDGTNWDDIVRSVTIPDLPENLGNTISGIVDDVENWSQQTGELGEEYSTLIYNVTQVEQANQANSLEIIGVKQKVGDSSVQAQISEFKNAQIGYENEAGEWVEGAAFAQAFEEVKINNLAGDELSVFSYFEALENAIGEIEGQIQFAIDANGRMTGIYINGSETVSEIIFLAQNTYWVNNEGYVVLGVNTETNDLEFFGSGRFWGKLVSPEFQMIGSNFMKVELADGFGPDNLWYWYGPSLLDGNGEPDFSNMSKSNAIEWKDTDGNAYFGGNLSAGALSNGARATLLSLNPSVEIGEFTTNGNPKQVVFGILWRGTYVDENACPTTQPADPTATLTLQRSLGGGSWETIKTESVTGAVITTQIDEPELGTTCVFNEQTTASFTYTDSHTSMGTFNYRVVVSNQYRHLMQQFITKQELSILSTEVQQ
ncbi:hypothetical protein A6F57_19840 [Alteromonas stellipolaris]|uniref:phage tail tip protein J-related protein n=1 Tax=Alteromonas stellipolaris TaxID=233316 RepID=UPI0007B436BD|nr:hypothetical protein [Alteromonas stellipolaris]ANB27233.1 hypothetical protein A6F57_19840 [Alteromonas stellipolaris]